MTAEERLKLQFISKFLNKYSYVYTHVCMRKKTFCCFFSNIKLLIMALYFSDPVKFCRTQIRISTVAKQYFHI